MYVCVLLMYVHIDVKSAGSRGDGGATFAPGGKSGREEAGEQCANKIAMLSLWGEV